MTPAALLFHVEREAYLRGLREELEARDVAALELAREANEAVA